MRVATPFPNRLCRFNFKAGQAANLNVMPDAVPHIIRGTRFNKVDDSQFLLVNYQRLCKFYESDIQYRKRSALIEHKIIEEVKLEYQLQCIIGKLT
jgi:hypothetical protein